MKKKTVTIGMLSYNRPLFLSYSIPQIFRKAGYDFKFILWDNNSDEETKVVEAALAEKYDFQIVNNSENLGLQALHHLVNMIDTDYYVLVEDDMLWFPENWLKDLVAAFETTPQITDKYTNKTSDSEWGIIATMCFVDDVNNGGMWPKRWGAAVDYTKDGINYLGNVHAAGGAMIMKTKLAKKYIIQNSHVFDQGIDHILQRFIKDDYLLAQARDICIYHAASPFYNEMYADIWKIKHKSKKQTIKHGFRAFEKTGLFNFKDKEWILTLLKNGLFQEYVKKLKPLTIDLKKEKE